jgi:hypothetical protein
MKTPILGSAYVARSVNAADNRMVNLFPEIVPEGGKEPAFLQRAPGLTALDDYWHRPQSAGCGRMASTATSCLAQRCFRSTVAGTQPPKGTVGGTGPVSMADNGTQLFIAANPQGYIYNASTDVFQQITDPDFPGAGTVGYLTAILCSTSLTAKRFG